MSYVNDYLGEYTQNIARSFRDFRILTNMREIGYATWENNFIFVFKGIMDVLERYDIATISQNPFELSKHIYTDRLKNDFRDIVRVAIEHNSRKYMLSRFLLIRVLDPDNTYKLFDDEEWYKKCLTVERIVFTEIMHIEDLDQDLQDKEIHRVEFSWERNDLYYLYNLNENELESKLIEYINKT